MELPSIVLVEKLATNNGQEVYYPDPLLEDRFRSTKPPHNSPSGRTPQPPTRGNPSEDFQSKVEKSLTAQKIDELRPVKMNDMRCNRINGWGVKEDINGMTTPGNSGDEIRSIHSSGSDQRNLGRSSRKRPFSASNNSGNGVEPLGEVIPCQHPEPSLKLAKPSDNDNDLLVETGPKQTSNQITNSIRTQLKTHFDKPGSAKEESLNQLALGMNRKGAASLFYQTLGINSFT